MTTKTAPATRVAFYYRRAGEKRWTLGGVFADAESAWSATLELDAKDMDLWFPVVPADGEVPQELTKRQQQDFKPAPVTG